MPPSNAEIKKRLQKRIWFGVGTLIILLAVLPGFYFYLQWQSAKQLADFYATVDFNLITDSARAARERIQAVFLIADAARRNNYGLIADALQQFENFENRLLEEQQKTFPHDSIPGMVYVPAGEFLFGGLGKFHGVPQDTSLSAYFIDCCPVTNSEFCQFLNQNGNQREAGALWYNPENGHIDSTADGFVAQPGFENHPVVSVNWYAAHAYAKWKGKRLPTEYEWEKAARGIFGRLYPWGSVFDTQKCNSASYWAEKDIFAANRDAWYEQEGRRLVDTTPVMQFPEGKSPYGCYDMCGNVWEWTSSKFERLLRDEPRFVNRGGAFSYGIDQIQNPHRGLGHPAVSGSITGFRCVMDTKKQD